MGNVIQILVPEGRKVKLVTADGILLNVLFSTGKPQGWDYEIQTYQNPLGYEPRQIMIEFEEEELRRTPGGWIGG